MWTQLAQSIENGNPYVIAILVFGFIGTMILFERLIMLQWVYFVDFSKFLNNFKKTVKAEDMDRAINLCKSVSHTSLPYISLRAIEAAETDPTTIKGTIEEETLAFLPNLEHRLGVLPAVSTLILLVGVLGTIDEIWTAFNAIQVLDTSEKQSRLAQGIAGSLNPTALGLILSMIFLTGHQILKGIAVRLTEKIHFGVTVLHNLLVPQEVAYMHAPIAAAVGAEAPAVVDNGAAPVNDYEVDAGVAAQEVVEEEDDSFDDASVEDIKDEEEII